MPLLLHAHQRSAHLRFQAQPAEARVGRTILGVRLRAAQEAADVKLQACRRQGFEKRHAFEFKGGGMDCQKGLEYLQVADTQRTLRSGAQARTWRRRQHLQLQARARLSDRGRQLRPVRCAAQAAAWHKQPQQQRRSKAQSACVT